MQNKLIWPAVLIICSVIVASGIYFGLRDNNTETSSQTYVESPSSNYANPGNHASSDTDTGDVIVYVTRTGECYHRSNCSYLSKSKIPMSLIEARKRYRPCSKCNPPR